MHPIIQQMLWYALVMLLTFICVDLLTQGFFHKFVKVFGSLGRQSFIKIRHSTYDGIAIGKEDDGFMVFRYHKKDYRLPIPNNMKVFYRFLFVQWVDVDGEKWALCGCDYNPVSGSDPVKVQNLLKRVIMAPQEDDNFKRIVLTILIILSILVLCTTVTGFLAMQKADKAAAIVSQLLQQSATITPATI